MSIGPRRRRLIGRTGLSRAAEDRATVTAPLRIGEDIPATLAGIWHFDLDCDTLPALASDDDVEDSDAEITVRGEMDRRGPVGLVWVGAAPAADDETTVTSGQPPKDGLRVMEHGVAGQAFARDAEADALVGDDPPSDEVRLDPRFRNLQLDGSSAAEPSVPPDGAHAAGTPPLWGLGPGVSLVRVVAVVGSGGALAASAALLLALFLALGWSATRARGSSPAELEAAATEPVQSSAPPPVMVTVPVITVAENDDAEIDDPPAPKPAAPRPRSRTAPAPVEWVPPPAPLVLPSRPMAAPRAPEPVTPPPAEEEKKRLFGRKKR